jgi:hypothetical protein
MHIPPRLLARFRLIPDESGHRIVGGDASQLPAGTRLTVHLDDDPDPVARGVVGEDGVLQLVAVRHHPHAAAWPAEGCAYTVEAILLVVTAEETPDPALDELSADNRDADEEIEAVSAAMRLSDQNPLLQAVTMYSRTREPRDLARVRAQRGMIRAARDPETSGARRLQLAQRLGETWAAVPEWDLARWLLVDIQAAWFGRHPALEAERLTGLADAVPFDAQAALRVWGLSPAWSAWIQERVIAPGMRGISPRSLPALLKGSGDDLREELGAEALLDLLDRVLPGSALPLTGSARPYLRQVVHNAVLNRLLEASRHVPTEEDALVELVLAAVAPEPEDPEPWLPTPAQVEALRATLTPRQLVILEDYLRQVPQAVTGAQVGIGDRMIRKELDRIRRLARQIATA